MSFQPERARSHNTHSILQAASIIFDIFCSTNLLLVCLFVYCCYCCDCCYCCYFPHPCVRIWSGLFCVDIAELRGRQWPVPVHSDIHMRFIDTNDSIHYTKWKRWWGVYRTSLRKLPMTIDTVSRRNLHTANGWIVNGSSHTRCYLWR